MGDVILDDRLPAWHFSEIHHRRTPAGPADLLRATEEVTGAEIPVLRWLMALRSAGTVRMGRRPVLDTMAGIGFVEIGRSGQEIVIGGIGRPWRVGGGSYDLAAADDPAAAFHDFAEPGWARVAANFHTDGAGLATETRVHCTDERSRRAFARYWALIRPFSGLIRLGWLAAIDRRARR